MRVVDVTSGPAGGLATMVLADFGADVIRVEPPGGDRFRSLPSACLWLRGKRSFAADLRTEDGRDDLRALVATADVLVVSGPPDRAARWGVDPAAAERLRPDLVHCSITGWGPVGPLAVIPGYEAAVAAASGRMLYFERQLRRDGPVFAAVPIAVHAAAQGAVQGILAALLARSRAGIQRVQRVETSLLQGLLPHDLAELLVVEMAVRSGIAAAEITAMGGDLPTLNYHPVRAGDGRWIQCGNLMEHLLFAFLDTTGLLEQMLADPRFADPPAMWDAEGVEAARDMILARLQERSAGEWMTIFTANGNVAAEPFLTTAEALDHPDLAASLVTLDDEQHGPVRMIGAMATLTRTPATIERPAPPIGQHTAEIKAELSDPRRQRRRPSDSQSDMEVTPDELYGRPLHGITVVEFATIIAAPLGTSMLADLGARVVKVEPVGGDPYRHLMRGGTTGAKTTAGKSSICLDLRPAEGRQIAQDLCRDADVVVHNSRPGVAEQLGLGEEDLRSVNPGIVWVSLTGYGRHGPSTNRPCTHPCAGAATGGAAHQAGAALDADCHSLEDLREISRQLMRANDPCPDPNTGVVLASAVLAALLARERDGIGQAVYVDMLTANMYANADAALDFEGKPPRPSCDAGLHGPAANYRLYPCAEGWLFLAFTTDGEWRRCAAVLERPELADDPRFADSSARALNDGPLASAISETLLGRTAADWEARFVAAHIAGVRADSATPGRFFSQAAQVLDNDFSPRCTHARFGSHRRWGPLVRVDDGLGAYGPGVLAGEHTDRILSELGHSPQRIEQLRDAGVVASEPIAFEW